MKWKGLWNLTIYQAPQVRATTIICFYTGVMLFQKIQFRVEVAKVGQVRNLSVSINTQDARSTHKATAKFLTIRMSTQTTTAMTIIESEKFDFNSELF